MDKKITTIDEFIVTYPPETQSILRKIRETIKQAAPGAEEKIAYGIPTFTLHGNLIHFSAYPAHIGLYPGPVSMSTFQERLDKLGYHTAKGTVQFPLDQPIPYDLIEEITRHCVQLKLQKH